MNKQTLQIGITGGIGAGKSIVCKLFTLLGIPIYYADDRAKWLMVNNLMLIKEIKKTFGEQAYLSSGLINRNYLAEVAFSKPAKLQLLNSLVHPKVAADYETWVKNNTEALYTLKEAALLFESGSYKQLHKVITITAPIATRIERVAARDSHRTKEAIKNIINKQLTEEKRQTLADYIIYNDGQQLLIPQVLALHKQFTKVIE